MKDKQPATPPKSFVPFVDDPPAVSVHEAAETLLRFLGASQGASGEVLWTLAAYVKFLQAEATKTACRERRR